MMQSMAADPFRLGRPDQRSGEIRLPYFTLEIGQGGKLLAVSDPGEPTSQEDLKNIFKRFYRTDKVRSMNHSYGPGLSIAKSIVQEHSGKIWAESKGGRNIFFAELPVSS